MDFSYVCKYCNKLYEISLQDLPPEIKDLIIKVKLSEKEKISKSTINPNLVDGQSNLFSENPPNMEINGIDMSFVKIDRISISDIITNLNIVLNNKICDLCYKKLSKINEEEIKKINDEIKNIEKIEKILNKEIESNKKEISEEVKNSKFEDAKAQEEASKRLNDDNLKLQIEFDKNLEKLKNINLEEKNILDEVNKLNLDSLLTSKDYEIEKSIQQKNQFEQICLLNSNILEFLFDIQVNEKYGSINGCRMQFKNYSSFNDISAGWGHILYLTKILNLKSKKILKILEENDLHKIYNLGDYSYIYSFQEKQKYFFYEKNSNLNDDLKAKNLNKSMLQYLQILKDLDRKVTKINGNTQTLKNFKIETKSINNYPIELNIYYQDDLDWALCLKSILMLLKSYIKIIVIKENEELRKILENKV